MADESKGQDGESASGTQGGRGGEGGQGPGGGDGGAGGDASSSSGKPRDQQTDSIWPKMLICTVLLLAVAVFTLAVVQYDQGVTFNERATQNQLMLCRLMTAHGQAYPTACDRYDLARGVAAKGKVSE